MDVQKQQQAVAPHSSTALHYEQTNARNFVFPLLQQRQRAQQQQQRQQNGEAVKRPFVEPIEPMLLEKVIHRRQLTSTESQLSVSVSSNTDFFAETARAAVVEPDVTQQQSTTPAAKRRANIAARRRFLRSAACRPQRRRRRQHTQPQHTQPQQQWAQQQLKTPGQFYYYHHRQSANEQSPPHIEAQHRQQRQQWSDKRGTAAKTQHNSEERLEQPAAGTAATAGDDDDDDAAAIEEEAATAVVAGPCISVQSGEGRRCKFEKRPAPKWIRFLFSKKQRMRRKALASFQQEKEKEWETANAVPSLAASAAAAAAVTAPTAVVHLPPSKGGAGGGRKAAWRTSPASPAAAAVHSVAVAVRRGRARAEHRNNHNQNHHAESHLLYAYYRFFSSSAAEEEAAAAGTLADSAAPPADSAERSFEQRTAGGGGQQQYVVLPSTQAASGNSIPSAVLDESNHLPIQKWQQQGFKYSDDSRAAAEVDGRGRKRHRLRRQRGWGGGADAAVPLAVGEQNLARIARKPRFFLTPRRRRGNLDQRTPVFSAAVAEGGEGGGSESGCAAGAAVPFKTPCADKSQTQRHWRAACRTKKKDQVTASAASESLTFSTQSGGHLPAGGCALSQRGAVPLVACANSLTLLASGQQQQQQQRDVSAPQRRCRRLLVTKQGRFRKKPLLLHALQPQLPVSQHPQQQQQPEQSVMIEKKQGVVDDQQPAHAVGPQQQRVQRQQQKRDEEVEQFRQRQLDRLGWVQEEAANLEGTLQQLEKRSATAAAIAAEGRESSEWFSLQPSFAELAEMAAQPAGARVGDPDLFYSSSDLAKDICGSASSQTAPTEAANGCEGLTQRPDTLTGAAVVAAAAEFFAASRQATARKAAAAVAEKRETAATAADSFTGTDAAETPTSHQRSSAVPPGLLRGLWNASEGAATAAPSRGEGGGAQGRFLAHAESETPARGGPSSQTAVVAASQQQRCSGTRRPLSSRTLCALPAMLDAAVLHGESLREPCHNQQQHRLQQNQLYWLPQQQKHQQKEVVGSSKEFFTSSSGESSKLSQLKEGAKPLVACVRPIAGAPAPAATILRRRTHSLRSTSTRVQHCSDKSTSSTAGRASGAARIPQLSQSYCSPGGPQPPAPAPAALAAGAGAGAGTAACVPFFESKDLTAAATAAPAASFETALSSVLSVVGAGESAAAQGRVALKQFPADFISDAADNDGASSSLSAAAATSPTTATASPATAATASREATVSPSAAAGTSPAVAPSSLADAAALEETTEKTENVALAFLVPTQNAGTAPKAAGRRVPVLTSPDESLQLLEEQRLAFNGRQRQLQQQRLLLREKAAASSTFESSPSGPLRLSKKASSTESRKEPCRRGTSAAAAAATVTQCTHIEGKSHELSCCINASGATRQKAAGHCPSVACGEDLACCSSSNVDTEQATLEGEQKQKPQRRSGSTVCKWQREEELKRLAHLLLDVVHVCMRGEKSDDGTCLYDRDGLTVWKHEPGPRRLLVKACFLAPVLPQQYAVYASDGRLRASWDVHLQKHEVLETISEEVDICRVALKRVATIFPRDLVTLRAKSTWTLESLQYRPPSFAQSCLLLLSPPQTSLHDSSEVARSSNGGTTGNNCNRAVLNSSKTFKAESKDCCSSGGGGRRKKAGAAQAAGVGWAEYSTPNSRTLSGEICTRSHCWSSPIHAAVGGSGGDGGGQKRGEEIGGNEVGGGVKEKKKSGGDLDRISVGGGGGLGGNGLCSAEAVRVGALSAGGLNGNIGAAAVVGGAYQGECGAAAAAGEVDENDGVKTAMRCGGGNDAGDDRLGRGRVSIRGQRYKQEEGESGQQHEWTVYSSCGCSIDHPDAPEETDFVRMDVRISAYVASPVITPFGVWTEITVFSEADPRGWIPAVVSRALAAKVLPSTVEKMTKNMLKHYGVSWDGGSATGCAFRRLAAFEEAQKAKGHR